MLRAPIRRAASYPGQLPVQADSSDGAPGAVGASAGPAARAGQVTLVAGEMVNRKPNVESLASAGVAGPAPQLQVTTVTDWDTAAISVLADPTRHVLFGPAFASVCRNCRSRAPTTPSQCPQDRASLGSARSQCGRSISPSRPTPGSTCRRSGPCGSPSPGPSADRRHSARSALTSPPWSPG